MKVSELIKLLESQDQDRVVYIHHDAFGPVTLKKIHTNTKISKQGYEINRVILTWHHRIINKESYKKSKENSIMEENND